eukprot:2974122-Lingulodinium_polyedra.AAC.1
MPIAARLLVVLVKTKLTSAKPAERGKTRHDEQTCACPKISICAWQHSMLNQLHSNSCAIETVRNNAHAPARDFKGAQHNARLCAWRRLNCAS